MFLAAAQEAQVFFVLFFWRTILQRSSTFWMDICVSVMDAKLVKQTCDRSPTHKFLNPPWERGNIMVVEIKQGRRQLMEVESTLPGDSESLVGVYSCSWWLRTLVQVGPRCRSVEGKQPGLLRPVSLQCITSSNQRFLRSKSSHHHHHHQPRGGQTGSSRVKTEC